jgi:serine/threonine-protein kinase
MSGPPGQDPDHSGELQRAIGDRYLIERVIARGGMAIVYLANDRMLERQVAIKLLDPERSSQLSAERFLREVRITAQLQHTNILPLIDSGRVDGLAYAVMPFVEGESLRDLLHRTARVPLADALLRAREIAEALEYAHQRGIVHRDIKPENILLSNGQAVISDFGVAYARHLASQGALTGVGETLGTPAYMSPEQIRGEAVDGRSDLYSLGCMVYEMLSGHPPFDEPSVRKVLNAHLHSEPEALETRAPETPERVVQLVRRAMAKAPAERFESAGAMAAALRRALGEPPRHATPSGAELAEALREKPPLLSRLKVSGALVWLVLLAAGLLALVPLLKRGSGTSRAGGGVPSVAVMLPRAEPDGSVPAYLTEGLGGEVIAELARHPNVRVTPQASSFAPALAALPALAVAESLDATHVVSTVVVPGDESYSATVRVLRALDGSPLWQRTYQFAEGNLGRIAIQIGDDALAEILGGSVTPSPARASSAKPLLPAVLVGRYWMARGTPEAMTKAREAFTAALAVDSTSVEALAGLANTRIRTAQYGYRSAEDSYTSLALAIDEAERALALAPESGDARFIAARAGRIAGRPRDSLIALVESALALSPNLPDALVDLAQLQGEAGNADSAIALAALAVRLNPYAPATRHGAITAALRVRRYDFAIEQARARLAQDPGDLVALALEGLALSAAGRSDECVDRAFGPWLAAQATCLHAAGRTAEARVAADSLRRLLAQGTFGTVHQFTDLGTYYAWTGNGTEAMVWIRQAAERTPLLIDWVFTSGLYDKALKDRTFVDQLQGLRKDVQVRLAARRPAKVSAEFTCESGETVRAEFRNDSAFVALPGQDVALAQAVSASGARYTDGDIQVWNKGKEITVSKGDSLLLQCRQK